MTDTLRAEIALANRILYRQGVVDAFGHVSARHPDRPDRFFLSRNMAPANVTAADVLELDEGGETVTPGAPSTYLERFIHAAIYRARPDVMSVVHSHSPSVVPLSAVKGMTLRCLCHMAGFIGDGAPVFEIRDHAGDATNLLITGNFLGDALAKTLGGAEIVLMRGHGSTVVGTSLRQAVFRAVYAETGARMQCQAMALGEPIFLTAAEAAAANAANNSQIARAWDLWASEAT